jgi:PAS domain S-box-containing protein
MAEELNHDSLCRQIVENAGDAVVYADREGTIRLWNRGAERVFGHAATEAVGASLDLIIPEPLRGRHWEGYRRTMATGETRYGEALLAVPALHRDGRRISIEFTVVPVHAADGGMAGIGAVIRDVTARREQEQALRKRLTELEGAPRKDVVNK